MVFVGTTVCNCQSEIASGSVVFTGCVTTAITANTAKVLPCMLLYCHFSMPAVQLLCVNSGAP